MSRRSTAARPRYVALADDLRDAIADGTYPVGGLLPTEIELCRCYDISRHTVREALRALSDQGLVHRRQGSGTQVVAREADRRFVQSLGSIADLFQYARDTFLELGPGEDAIVRGELALLLGSANGRAWRKYSGPRRGQPGAPAICLTDVYIDPAFADIEPYLAGRGGAVSELIQARHGQPINEIHQEIGATTLDADQAEALEAETGAAALRIVRRYLGAGGRAIEASISIHPAERYAYSVRLKREGG